MDKYQQAEYDWRQCVLRVGRKETAVFESNNIAYTKDLMLCNARRHLMVWIYSHLVSYKLIQPIEKLDEDVKKEMWRFIIEIWDGKEKDKKKMIQTAKVFYTIEYFLNEKQIKDGKSK
jgi:hypothetical protein